MVHSNRCSNHFLGSSSWRKIIVAISGFPNNFCFTFYSFVSLFSSQGPGGAFAPLVGSNGLEPSTSRLSGVRSNHLSYEPISVAVRCAIRPNLLLRLFRFFIPRLLTSSLDEPRARIASAARRGGDEQNRTVDPLLARQVLSQLSYAPVLGLCRWASPPF